MEEDVFANLTDEELLLEIEKWDKARDAAKQIFEKYKHAISEAHQRFNGDKHWQTADGIVYQLSTQDGRWVTFEPLVANRTRRDGEVKGTLSEKAAKELGYKLK